MVHVRSADDTDRFLRSSSNETVGVAWEMHTAPRQQQPRFMHFSINSEIWVIILHPRQTDLSFCSFQLGKQVNFPRSEKEALICWKQADKPVINKTWLPSPRNPLTTRPLIGLLNIRWDEGWKPTDILNFYRLNSSWQNVSGLTVSHLHQNIENGAAKKIVIYSDLLSINWSQTSCTVETTVFDLTKSYRHSSRRSV